MAQKHEVYLQNIDWNVYRETLEQFLTSIGPWLRLKICRKRDLDPTTQTECSAFVEVGILFVTSMSCIICLL